MKNKTFDCVEMKRAAQERIRARVEGMTPVEEIAFFRAGGVEFEKAIRQAKQGDRVQAAPRRPRSGRRRRVVRSPARS